MNPFTLSLLALGIGLLGQALASGLALERLLRPGPASRRGLWLALACGSLLIALQHGYSIELALRTGLYDFRQAVIGGIGSLLCGLAIASLSRRS